MSTAINKKIRSNFNTKSTAGKISRELSLMTTLPVLVSGHWIFILATNCGCIRHVGLYVKRRVITQCQTNNENSSVDIIAVREVSTCYQAGILVLFVMKT